MSTVVATKDANARVSVRTQHGPLNLSESQAKTQFVPTTEYIKVFTPQTVGSWSTYSSFSLDPQSMPDHVDKITLVYQLGAASKTGGTYINLVGDASWLSRLIEVSIGSELVASMYPEAGYIQSILHYTNEHKAVALPAAGNLALSTRKTNTANGQTLYIDLPIPFIQKYGWLTKSQSAPMVIKVSHADLTAIVDTDGTAPVLAISALTLNVSGRSFISQANLGAVVANQKKLGRVDERYLDVVQMSSALASGSAVYTVQLQSFVGLYDHFHFVVRATSSVATALGNAPDNLVAIQSFNVKDSGGNLIVPELTSAYNLGPYLDKFVKGDATDVASGLGSVQKYVYSVFFGSRPEDAIRKGTQHGYFKMTGLEKLQITFSSAIGSNYQVDVIGFPWANLSADANGIIKKSLVTV